MNRGMIEKVKPLIRKGFLISYMGKVIKKRKLKNTEEIVNQFLVPNGKVKLRKLYTYIARMLRGGTAILDSGYILTPSNRVIFDNDKVRDQLQAGGFYEKTPGIYHRKRGLSRNSNKIQDNKSKVKMARLERVDKGKYKVYVKEHPFHPSRKSSIVRKQFCSVENLRSELIDLHAKQKFQYRLNILLGYQLRNIESGELVDYYPSYNTAMFDETPLVSVSIKSVLDQLSFDSVSERIRRPSSRYVVHKIVEYIITYTPIEEVLIGANVKLPDYIRLSRSIVGFEGAPSNLCFWFCFEADIEVPQHLKERFKDFQPIFKNIEIKYDDLSEATKKQVSKNYKSKKLIASYKGEKILFHTDMLKWYLENGLVVSNVTYAVRYERKSPFKNFVQHVSNARRLGDKSEEYKLIGEMMKLMANSSVGKTITNFLKHEKVSIITEDKFNKNMKSPDYKNHEDLDQGYEFHFKKMKHKQDLPIQIGFAVYNLAKLKMLEFYYDFLDFYVDRSDYQLIQTDTDSMYVALSAAKLEDVIRPDLKQHFEENKHKWFGRVDTEENILYDKREPGFFKQEFEGTGIIALSSKMYYAFNEETSKDKFSSKGLNKNQNELTKERYMRALDGYDDQTFTNRGFRVKDNKMFTYSLEKTGMKLFNDKRLRVGNETMPIEV